MKSVSAETYKCIKSECEMFLSRIDFYKDKTEICNDFDIMSRLALSHSLLEQIVHLIHE